MTNYLLYTKYGYKKLLTISLPAKCCSWAHQVLPGALSSHPSSHNSPSASLISESLMINSEIVPSSMNLQTWRKEKHQTCNYTERVWKRRMWLSRGLEKVQLPRKAPPRKPQLVSSLQAEGNTICKRRSPALDESRIANQLPAGQI